MGADNFLGGWINDWELIEEVCSGYVWFGNYHCEWYWVSVGWQVYVELNNKRYVDIISFGN